MDNNIVKKNIYRFRKAKGYTQEQMAKSIGISVTHFRNIENGKTWLINPMLGKIAKKLGVDAEDLIADNSYTEEEDGILEEDAVPYRSRYRHMACRMEQMQTELEESLERESSLRRRISELELSMNDLRFTIKLLTKRIRESENPEKI